MIVKFNDQNGCEFRHLKTFDNLPYKNKLCFTVTEHKNLSCVVNVKAPKNHKYIRASYEPFGKSKYIDINYYINNL